MSGWSSWSSSSLMTTMSVGTKLPERKTGAFMVTIDRGAGSAAGQRHAGARSRAAAGAHSSAGRPRAAGARRARVAAPLAQQWRGSCPARAAAAGGKAGCERCGREPRSRRGGWPRCCAARERGIAREYQVARRAAGPRPPRARCRAGSEGCGAAGWRREAPARLRGRGRGPGPKLGRVLGGRPACQACVKRLGAAGRRHGDVVPRGARARVLRPQPYRLKSEAGQRSAGPRPRHAPARPLARPIAPGRRRSAAATPRTADRACATDSRQEQAPANRCAGSSDRQTDITADGARGPPRRIRRVERPKRQRADGARPARRHRRRRAGAGAAAGPAAGAAARGSVRPGAARRAAAAAGGAVRAGGRALAAPAAAAAAAAAAGSASAPGVCPPSAHRHPPPRRRGCAAWCLRTRSCCASSQASSPPSRPSAGCRCWACAPAPPRRACC
jgi:hypothetical protein